LEISLAITLQARSVILGTPGWMVEVKLAVRCMRDRIINPEHMPARTYQTFPMRLRYAALWRPGAVPHKDQPTANKFGARGLLQAPAIVLLMSSTVFVSLELRRAAPQTGGEGSCKRGM
jgi:hypothetical protein